MKTCFGNALLRVDLNHKIILKGNDNVAVLEFRPTDCWDRLTVLATEPVTVKVLKYDYVILFDNLSSTEIINRIEEGKKAKRLTEYIGKLSDKPQAVPIMSDSKIGTQDCLNRLAEYEDLEEKGLLLRLPCKVGDTIYFETFVKNGSESIGVQPHKVVEVRVSFVCDDWPDTEVPDWAFGKTAFLSKEEAENHAET